MANKLGIRNIFFVYFCASLTASHARAGLDVNVTFQDPGGTNAAYHDRIRDAMRDAAAAWGRYIETEPVTLQIQLNFTSESTASAGNLSHRFDSVIGGVATYEVGAIIKLTTGEDINFGAYDAVFNIGLNWLTNMIWWNPAPGSPSPPPAGKIDSHYVFMHEIGHILGFASYRENSGRLPIFNGSPYQTTFDAHTSMLGGNLYFTGDAAMHAHGGQPVPLTFGNFSHVGNSSASGRPGSDLVNDVMNGVVSRSIRYELSALDVAILEDLGYTLSAEGRNLVYGRSAVPDPASIIALAVGLSGLGACRAASRRRRAA
ncbi:hypothetical protein [Paludisphaera sp.]|uniref:hypothetical protein n=1 Tax=Paludisphaera sp. TaxID=2017432 RepID=UPI00301B7067